MTQIVSSAAVSIFPTFKGLRSRTAKEAAEAGRTFGERFGRMSKVGSEKHAQDLLSPLRRAVASANRDLTKARNEQRDATAKVTIAEKRLAEVIKRSGEDSSQAMSATLRLEQAKRRLAAANEQATFAAEVLASRQNALQTAVANAQKAVVQLGAGWGKLGNRIKTTAKQFYRGFRDMDYGNSVAGGIAGSFGALSRSLVDLAGFAIKRWTRGFINWQSVGQRSLSVLSQGLAQIHKLASAVGGAFTTAKAHIGHVLAAAGNRVKSFALQASAPIRAVAHNIAQVWGPAFAPVGRALSSLGSKIATAIGVPAQGAMGTLGGIVTAGFKGVHSAFSAGLSGMRSLASGIGSIAGNAVTAAFIGITAAIGANLSGAIDRVDTLRNFPKVMKNMGFSAEESTASMEKLEKGVRGLPTSLNEIVSVSQRFAPTLGNLGKATDLTLALNNALLAGPEGALGAARGFTQFSQVLGKQKVEMQDWKILMEVMPAQLTQLARSFLGPQANAITLFEALKSGDVTFEELTNRIIEMNKKGLDGFGSFEQQARDATGGIKTSMRNVANAIQRNIGSIIEAIGADKFVTASKSISDALDSIGKRIVDVIAKVKEAGNGSFTKAFEGLAPLAGAFAPLLGALAPLLGKIPLLGRLFAGLTGPVGLAIGVITALWTNSEKLRSAFAGAGEAIAGAFSGIKINFSEVSGSIQQAFQSVGDFLAPAITSIGQGIAAVIPVVVEFATAIGERLGTMATTLGPTFQTLGEIFTSVAAAIGPLLPPIFEVISGIFGVLASVIEAVLPPLVELFNQLTPILGLVSQAIQMVLEAVAPLLKPLGDLIATYLPYLISLFTAILQPVIKLAGAIISNLIPILKGLLDMLSGVINFVVGVFTGNWSQAWSGVRQIFSGFVNAVTSLINGTLKTVFYEIPGFIRGIFSGVGGWLYNAGSALINGFINGIYSAFDAVRSTLSELTSLLPDWKGPVELDKVILKDAGQLVIGGFVDGMESQYSKAQQSLKKFTNGLQTGTPKPTNTTAQGRPTPGGITVIQNIQTANVPNASDLASKAAEQARLIGEIA